MSDVCPNISLSSSLYTYAIAILAIPTAVYLFLYLIPHLYVSLSTPVDLKQKYGAEWALVTGGGSGIGRSLCFALAAQNLNVVVVSLDDDFLKKTMKDLSSSFPSLEFRSVAVTFSPKVDYLKMIVDATSDINVQCIFNNAGFILTGFLDQCKLAALESNMECNATAAVKITHHFLAKLVSSKQKGCIVFTSSVAGFIPTPFASLYAATKAFLSSFACCVNIEVASLGIDVVAVHPSPVNTNFYDKVDHKIELMESAQKQAVEPDELPKAILRSVGRCALSDIGGMAFGTRIGTWFLPFNIFTKMFAVAAPYLPDYKKHNANRK